MRKTKTTYAVRENGCWEWQNAIVFGYGTIRRDNKKWKAHRWFYTQAKGEIPAGLVLDHLCKNTICVNPDHLEPVTQKENILRGNGNNLAKTHCPKGHEYDEKNTYSYQNRRYCKACRKHK